MAVFVWFREGSSEIPWFSFNQTANKGNWGAAHWYETANVVTSNVEAQGRTFVEVVCPTAEPVEVENGSVTDLIQIPK